MKTVKAKSTDSEARQRILETAKRLFYQQGYLATGINQVIEEAKVAKNTFYYYFPSKEDLCVAYLEERHELWNSWLQTKLKGVRDPLKKILSIFDFVTEWMKDCKFRGCAFLNIMSEIPETECKIRAVALKHIDEFHRTIEGLVSDLKLSGGSYGALNVKEVSRAIYVLAEGSIVGSQGFGDCWPAASARKAAAILLKAGN